MRDGVLAPDGGGRENRVASNLPALRAGVEGQLLAAHTTPAEGRIAHEFEGHLLKDVLRERAVRRRQPVPAPRNVGVKTAEASCFRAGQQIGSQASGRFCPNRAVSTVNVALKGATI